MSTEDRARIEAVLSAFSEAVGGVRGLQKIAAQEEARQARLEAHERREQEIRHRACRLGRRRCIAKTKAGERCARPALAGRIWCGQHAKAVAPKFTNSDQQRVRLAVDWHEGPSHACARACKSLVEP